MLTVDEVRADCPLLKRVTYLDSGATSLTPLPILNAMTEYVANLGVNVERGAYRLAQESSEVWDAARRDAAKLLLNAPPEEFIFVRNCTEGVNTVAHGLFSFMDWEAGDEIVGTTLDHHANVLPWMHLAKQTGAKYRMLHPAGAVMAPSDVADLSPNTRVVALQHVSNVLGSEHPLRDIIKAVRARAPGAFVFVDGSQGAGHLHFDVHDPGCDAYAFSGHKGAMGPPGTGGLWLRKSFVDAFEPLLLGGGIVSNVTETDYALRLGTKRFEAGTPNTMGLVGLGRAAKYVGEEIGIEKIHQHEQALTRHLLGALEDVKGVTVYGPDDVHRRVGTVPFNVDGWRATDLALAVDETSNVLVRAGHHCAMPLARRLGIDDEFGGNARASFHYYNTFEDCDRLVTALRRLTE